MCFPLKKTPGKPQALPEIFRKREFHNNKYCCICQYIFLSCSSAAMPETGRPTLLYQAACDIPHFLTHPALLTNFPAAGDAPCSVLPLPSRPQSFPPEKKAASSSRPTVLAPASMRARPLAEHRPSDSCSNVIPCFSRYSFRNGLSKSGCSTVHPDLL